MAERAYQKGVNLRGISQRLDLERQDLEERVEQVRAEYSKFAHRKLVLDDEWKKLKLDQARLEQDKKNFEFARKSSWFQSTLLPTSDLRRIKLNVGGKLFETTERVLKRDPGSLLAALVSDDAPLKEDEEGTIFIDRDWWLFRFLLAFLRDGRIPKDQDLLSQLYREAGFYNLETIRHAIREFLDPNHIVERSAAMPLSQLHRLEASLGKTMRRIEEENQTDAVNALKRGLEKQYEELEMKANEQEKEKDWWTSSRYKGRDFDDSTSWAKVDKGW
eukprot:CAMPEP_0204842128 /NCGR_PEP_ID=MMETSP1346-20131115/44839_1 /ASSEMBLY_ACC=CAM_ASM_000771 /TAXON_ID=215587 /ORGANISM="Aplanochytrium stocchinoi, Strain GSBS06" /LENGTH=274 /DNA_ID=CAMNT_0051980697 /DNA_START=63 /DNA_END=884 /DNA_ORIENTATION=+